MLLFGLLILSIITGYVGMISYRLFDYLVETNIRNYTIVTAFVFFGLSLSAIIAKKVKLSFRGIMGATGLGILTIFIAPAVVPPLANFFIDIGVNTWFIYAIAGIVLIIPLYALIGVSIPSAIRLGFQLSIK
jgi:FtsH-binding integral membrane protein